MGEGVSRHRRALLFHQQESHAHMREPWVATLLPPQLEAPAPQSKAPCEHQ